MKFFLNQRAFAVAVLVLAAQTYAATKYWDINGDTPGAGGASPSGTWDTTTANWTEDPTGSIGTTAYTAGDTAAFSAGSDATGTYTITATTGLNPGAITNRTGWVNFAGSQVSMGNNHITVLSGATMSVGSSTAFAVTANGGATIVLDGGTWDNRLTTSAGNFFGTASTATFLIHVTENGGVLRYDTPNVLCIIQTGTPGMIISGPGGITKTGRGVLAVSTACTYSGATIINEGELRIRNTSNRLPTGTAVTVNSPGILNLNGLNQQIGSLAGNGSVGLCNATLTVSSSSSSTFDGTIADIANAGASGATTTGGKLTKAGTGTLTLNGDNTYTGQTTINGGAITVSSLKNVGGGSSGLGAPATVANGTIKIGTSSTSASLRYNSTAASTTDRVIDLGGTTGGASLYSDNNAGAITFTSDFTATGAGTKTLTLRGGSTALNTISGKIVDNSSANITRVAKSDTGTWVLSGANTYSGTTTINRGNLYINSIADVNGGPSALGAPTTTADGTIALSATTTAGALRYTGSGHTTDRVVNLAGTTAGGSIYASGSGPLVFTSDFTATGAGSKTLTLRGANTDTNTIGGAIVDNSAENTTALTKTDAGKWILAGANTYTGNTTVSQGTLQVDGSIGNSAVTVAGAGILGGSGTVGGAVALSGTVAPGASIGELTTGAQAWNGGGKYEWEVGNTTGTPGVDWDRLVVTGDIDVQATAESKFTIKVAGDIANFDKDTNYEWSGLVAPSGAVLNFDAAKFAAEYSAVVNDLAGGTFTVAEDGVKVKFTKNNPPSASNRNVQRVQGVALKINVADLLANNSSDPDDDARALVDAGVDTAPSKGTVSVSGGYVLYQPTDVNSTDSDSFSFKVRDVRSAYRDGDTVRTAVALINVSVVSAAGGAAQTIDTSGGEVSVKFAGIPGYPYAVERAEDVNFTVNLTTVLTTNAPAAGVFGITDSNPPSPQAYYRLRYNP